jgi:hypothetical protein
MKPRLFIGSSTESLRIANAIQENLQYDCLPTIWSQGMFNLSSTAMDDLIDAAEKTDFAVFVFHSDDIIISRDTQMPTVRDNIIFELGLFIGKLGKKRVFFLQPKGIELKVPTDLLGIIPGIYDETRTDNLLASLGPFCNQLREIFRNFIYESINDLQNESPAAKKIAIEKPRFWEHLLAAELLKERFEKIDLAYQELEKGLIFRKQTYYDLDESMMILRGMIGDIMSLVKLFSKIILDEFEASFGPPGVAGKIVDIKRLCDRLESIGKELVAWEFRLQEINFPDELDEVKKLMNGWTKPLFSSLNGISNELEKLVDHHLNKREGKFHFNMVIDAPKNIDQLNELLGAITEKRRRGLI